MLTDIESVTETRVFVVVFLCFVLVGCFVGFFIFYFPFLCFEGVWVFSHHLKPTAGHDCSAGLYYHPDITYLRQ